MHFFPSNTFFMLNIPLHLVWDVSTLSLKDDAVVWYIELSWLNPPGNELSPSIWQLHFGVDRIFTIIRFFATTLPLLS
jgi:hypothetical protein